MRRSLASCAVTCGVVGAGLAPAWALGSWTAPVPISASDENGEDPQVAMSVYGNAVVVWQTNTAGGEQIVASVQAGYAGPWSAPHPVSPVGPAVYGQRVAMDGNGGAVVVWESSGRIQVSRRPAGGTWQDPRTLSGRHAHFPAVAANKRGDVTIVWQRHIDDHDRLQAAHRPMDGHWSKVRTLTGGFGQVVHPQVAMDRRGAATVVWERMWADGGRSAVFVTRRRAGGGWTDARRLSAKKAPASGPLVAMDRRGDAIAAWTGELDGSAHIFISWRRRGEPWPHEHAIGGNGFHLGDLDTDHLGDAMVVGLGRTKSGDSRIASLFGHRARVDSSWDWLTNLDLDGAHRRAAVGLARGYATFVAETSEGVNVRELSQDWRPGPVRSLSEGAEGFDVDVAMDGLVAATVCWMWLDTAHDRVVVTSN